MRVEELEQEFDVRVTWKGYEIHPDLPAGGLPRDVMFGRGSHFRQTQENLRRLADEAGLTMKPPAIIANTHLALEASEFAKDKGMFDGLHRRLFEAYFQEGVNIGDIEALLRLAGEVGLDEAELRQALAEGRYRSVLQETIEQAHWNGISGTPTFIIGDKCVVGAQPYEVLRQAAARAGAQRRGDRTS